MLSGGKSEFLYRGSRLVYLTGLFVVILSYLSGLEAATTGRKQTQAIIPTNAGGKASTRRVMEPAFANAGKVPGLEVWRIENFKPVAYPKNDYGKFHTGDSYIVLFTKEKNGVKSWDIHFWLGSETSQDEAGAAAILSVQLDDQLGGGPVQYREVQEHESQAFLSRFKSGVRYAPGGVQSGFTHVDRNQHEKKLYQIKGKRNIRVKQVDLTIASMNKGDCFILDIGTNVYVYVGSKAKRVEKLKAISAANQIRDQDHGGRAKVNIVDESSPPSEYDEFFTALGGGSAADVPDESVGGDDEQFEKNQEKSVTLHRISDATGKLQIQQITQKPLLQSMLDTNDCFILDTSDSNLYVWVGKKCNTREKNEAMSKAQQFLKDKKYPAWTQIQRVVENAESATFQQYFKTWKSAGELHSRLIRSADKAPPTKLENKSAGEAPEFMPDDGSGDLEIFRVEDMELVPVDKENYGKFFGGDSYVIKYSYRSRYIIYIWQGKQSTNDEKAASAIQAVNMDNELGGMATQIRVVQDHEPKHFLHVFKGKLVVFLGGKASGFKNLKDHDTYVEGETRMFRIRGTEEENVRGSQQIAEAKYLASDDVFIVENDNHAWIWMGKGSDAVERKLASSFAKLLVNGAATVVIKEGDEPEEFWDALGGKEEYNEVSEETSASQTEPQLYHVIINKKKISTEHIDDFEQDDLIEDDVMVLDAGSQLYIWIGQGADQNERELSVQVAHKYLKKYERTHVVIIVVKQGEEPKAFKSLFPKWNGEDMSESIQSVKSLRAVFGN